MARLTPEEKASRDAGCPPFTKDRKKYYEEIPVKVPESKLIPRDFAGSMTQGRPDKTRSFASKKQIAEASQTGGNSDPQTHIYVAAHKQLDGAVSSPNSLGEEGDPISERGPKVRGTDSAARNPRYQFSTTNLVRDAKIQPFGTARKCAVKQGAANDNKTQENSAPPWESPKESSR